MGIVVLDKRRIKNFLWKKNWVLKLRKGIWGLFIFLGRLRGLGIKGVVLGGG